MGTNKIKIIIKKKGNENHNVNGVQKRIVKIPVNKVKVIQVNIFLFIIGTNILWTNPMTKKISIINGNIVSIISFPFGSIINF